eukprot:scaffold46830_cov35-Phaeocystis_antarctica.AAC.1
MPMPITQVATIHSTVPLLKSDSAAAFALRRSAASAAVLALLTPTKALAVTPLKSSSIASATPAASDAQRT